jgi:hypothetical protein
VHVKVNNSLRESLVGLNSLYFLIFDVNRNVINFIGALEEESVDCMAVGSFKKDTFLTEKRSLRDASSVFCLQKVDIFEREDFFENARVIV